MLDGSWDVVIAYQWGRRWYTTVHVSVLCGRRRRNYTAEHVVVLMGKTRKKKIRYALSIRIIKGVGELMEVCINFFQTAMRTERDRLCLTEVMPCVRRSIFIGPLGLVAIMGRPI